MTTDRVIKEQADSLRHGLHWWLTNRINQARLDLGMLQPLPREEGWPERRLRREPASQPREDVVVVFHFDGTATIAIPRDNVGG